MFTAEEMQYMKRELNLHFDFDNLSDNEWAELEDAVADRLGKNGFDENYALTFDGKICESIIDKIP